MIGKLIKHPKGNSHLQSFVISIKRGEIFYMLIFSEDHRDYQIKSRKLNEFLTEYQRDKNGNLVIK